MSRKKRHPNNLPVVRPVQRRLLPWELNPMGKVTQSVYLGYLLTDQRPQPGTTIRITEYKPGASTKVLTMAEILSAGKTFQTRTIWKGLIGIPDAIT